MKNFNPQPPPRSEDYVLPRRNGGSTIELGNVTISTRQTLSKAYWLADVKVEKMGTFQGTHQNEDGALNDAMNVFRRAIRKEHKMRIRRGAAAGKRRLT